MTERRARISRRWYDIVLDLLAVAGILAIVMFPVAALTSVSPEPNVADAAVTLPRLGDHPRRGGSLRDLPVFSVAGLIRKTIASGQLSDRASLDALIAAQTRVVFGSSDDGGLLERAMCCHDKASKVTTVAKIETTATAPLRFATIDAILDARLGTGPLSPERVGAVSDLAGLYLLARQSPANNFSNASPIAYSLYDRARRAGGCEPQLGVAMLSSAAEFDLHRYERTVAEYQAAVRNCPADDPTPLWLLGQFQSIQQHVGPARATFRRLEIRLPGSVLGWSGEADALVREAYRIDVESPFTARVDFHLASALYGRARSIGASRHDRAAAAEDHDPGLAAGEARARSGFGDFAGAAALDRVAIRNTHTAGAGTFRERLIHDLERAARFADTGADRARHFIEAAAAATTAAAHPAADDGGGGGVTSGPQTTTWSPDAGVFRFGSSATNSDNAAGAVVIEHALGPISVRATRVQPLKNFGDTLGFTDGAADISFIPQFRETLVTGPTSFLTGDVLTGWCRAGRDLMLAGRAPAALAGPLATGTGSNRCSDEQLHEIAQRETGAPHTTGNPGGLLDAEQNLWRFAGDLERAAAATKAWTALTPTDRRAWDQAGEVAYLSKDFVTAAQHFGVVAKLARSDDAAVLARPENTDANVRAEAAASGDLKAGTALEMAGDLEQAATTLRSADDTAGALLGPGRTDLKPLLAEQAQLDSYNARLQLGDTTLRRHTAEMDKAESARTFGEAETHYEAAREREARLRPARAVILANRTNGRREPLFRPEVLENNQALVLVQLGKTGAASTAIDAAIAADPANPVFLGNKGYIEETSHRPAAATATYRATLRADPSAYQTANNLGVILADDGHLPDAERAFRQAIAARRQYGSTLRPADDGRAAESRDGAARAKAAGSDYPIATFNLGLVLNRMGPSHLLESQGELAAATRADPELREHDHEFISDKDTVFTTLDLSKPLPHDWHLASAEQRAPITAAGVVLALLLFIAFRTVVEEKIKEKATEEALETDDRLLTRIRRISERIPAGVAVAAVVGVFAFPLVRSSGATRNDYLLIGIGVAIMTLAFMRLRSAMARREGMVTRHYTHLPAVLVGGATALLSLGYAPMPAAKDHESLPGYARWAGTGLLGILTLTLLVTGRFTGVPLATHLGEAGLVMTASTLIPIKPYDGAYLEKGHLGFLAAFALTCVAVLVELRVL